MTWATLLTPPPLGWSENTNTPHKKSSYCHCKGTHMFFTSWQVTRPWGERWSKSLESLNEYEMMHSSRGTFRNETHNKQKEEENQWQQPNFFFNGKIQGFARPCTNAITCNRMQHCKTLHQVRICHAGKSMLTPMHHTVLMYSIVHMSVCTCKCYEYDWHHQYYECSFSSQNPWWYIISIAFFYLFLVCMSVWILIIKTATSFWISVIG